MTQKGTKISVLRITIILPSEGVRRARMLKELLVFLFVHAGSRVQFGYDHTRIYGVHTNVVRSELQCGASGQLIDGCLTHVVGNHTWKGSAWARRG